MNIGPPTVFVLLHGLPFSDADDPFSALSGLIEAIRTHEPHARIEQFKWAAEIAEDRRLHGPGPLSARLAIAAGRGDLGRIIAESLGPFLTKLGETHEAQTLVVGGYSAGGWGLFEWLLTDTPSNATIRQSIAFAFTVGSPFRNVYATAELNGRLRNTAMWELDHRSLAGALHAGALHCVYSPTDQTVRADNAAIPSDQIVTAQRSRRLRVLRRPDAGSENIHVLALDGSVPHGDLCRDPAGEAVTWLMEHLLAAPNC